MVAVERLLVSLYTLIHCIDVEWQAPFPCLAKPFLRLMYYILNVNSGLELEEI